MQFFDVLSNANSTHIKKELKNKFGGRHCKLDKIYSKEKQNSLRLWISNQTFEIDLRKM